VRLIPSEAIVLAGGLGTRLREALPGVPKVLAPIDGRPFLELLLRRLAGQGVASVVLATGWNADLVEAAATQWASVVDLTFSREERPLGTGGAIARAFEHVRGDRAWVMNGDTFCEIDLHAVSAIASPAPGDPWLVGVEVDDAGRFGTIEVDGSRVVAFSEKTGRGERGTINSGTYILPRDLMAPGEYSIEYDRFPLWLAQGRLRAVVVDARFIDIGTSASLGAAKTFFQ
jgi:D-glycero-alpha-D-manno-heptose 1-phosphate guanylyltransferase